MTDDRQQQWAYPGCFDCDDAGNRQRLEQTRRTSGDTPTSGRTVYECPQCGAEYVLWKHERYEVERVDE